jgi:hypothetical protein
MIDGAMLLTRFLSYFARVAAPATPAKIRFVIHDQAGQPIRLCNVRSVEFDLDAATWSVNLGQGLALESAKGNGNAEAAPDTR